MTTTQHRDALAKVIDPESWDLYDDERMVGRSIREDIVKESRAVADRIVESGLMASGEWDRREYYAALEQIKEHTSKTGKCYSQEDGMDGYFVHDPKCARWPEGAIGGTGCIG